MSAVQSRFTKIIDVDGNHVATVDTQTGLEWTPVGDKAQKNQQAAEKAAGTLDFRGGGWRLPTIDELQTIIDRSTYNPAADADAFPFIKPDWYWTSTPAAWSSASAWGVYFYHGGVSSYHRDDYGFALAVRRAGQ